jgi:hypothetical protein
VCLLPGTEVAFEGEARYEHGFDRLMPGLRFGFVGESLARFRQVNMDRALAHHDALEFANGQIVLVTRLIPGQRVLQAGSSVQEQLWRVIHTGSREHLYFLQAF